jgi:hypothetical protein
MPKLPKEKNLNVRSKFNHTSIKPHDFEYIFHVRQEYEEQREE